MLFIVLAALAAVSVGIAGVVVLIVVFVVFSGRSGSFVFLALVSCGSDLIDAENGDISAVQAAQIIKDTFSFE